jgi:hypothetical protein
MGGHHARRSRLLVVAALLAVGGAASAPTARADELSPPTSIVVPLDPTPCDGAAEPPEVVPGAPVSTCSPAANGPGESHAEYRPGGVEEPAPAPAPAPPPTSAPVVTPTVPPTTVPPVPPVTDTVEVAAPSLVRPSQPPARTVPDDDPQRVAKIAALATPTPAAPVSSGTLWTFVLCGVAIVALGAALVTVPKRTARRP